MSDLSYPIGRFQKPETITPEGIQTAISEIAGLPSALREVVGELTDEQLDRPYRPGGWTVRQTVHHLADSHMHAYIRLRFAVDQDNPTIQAYNQDTWASLPDAVSAPIEPSLAIIEGVHQRLAILLNSLTPEQLARPYQHPEYGGRTINGTVFLYAWHGKHHIAHIKGVV